MLDYTTRYTFEIDLIEQDVAQKAQQIAQKLERILVRDVAATRNLTTQQQALRVSYDETNIAITSQTRRLLYHMRRLEEVENRIRSLAAAEKLLYQEMSAAGERVFDSLVESARQAFDKIVGHSILSDMLREAKAIYDRLQSLGYGSFDAVVADASRFLDVIRAIRAEMAGMERMSGMLPLPTSTPISDFWGGGAGGGAPPLLPPAISGDAQLPVPWSPQNKAEFDDFIDSFAVGKYTMEDWFNTFNRGLNQATLQWFGLRRLGYGFESIGRSMTRMGSEIFDALNTLSTSYIEFNEVATRAAMAMEMQVGMQDVLEEKILDTSQALGLFAPEEIAEGLRLWVAGTGEIIRTESALNTILERTIDLQKLAAMNNEELATVTQLAGGIMHEFGMEMSDISHIAEVLNFVAAKTFAAVSDVGDALQFVGPTAEQMGVSLEEVAAVVGLLADVNIVASRSGRALRQMFVQMLKPTKEHTDALNAALDMNVRLGESWEDIVFPGGEFIGLAKYIDLIAAATEDWTDQQRAALFATMATANELPVITALVEEQIKARKEGRNVIEEETAALGQAQSLMEQMWKRYEESDVARVNKMRARWDAAMKSMGKAATEAGVPAAERLVNVVLKIGELIEKYPWLAGAAMWTAGINVIAGSLLTIVGKLFGVVANMMIMRGAFAAFGTSTGIFSAAVKQFAIAAGLKSQAVYGVGAPAAAAGGTALLPTWLTALGLAGISVKMIFNRGAAGMFEQLEEEAAIVQEHFAEMFAPDPYGARAFIARGEEGLALIRKILGENEKWISQGEQLELVLAAIRDEYGVIVSGLPMIGKGPGMAPEAPRVVAPDLYPEDIGVAPELSAQWEINDQLVALQEDFEERIADVRRKAAEKRADEQRKWADWQADAWDEHLKRNVDIEDKYNKERIQATEEFLRQQVEKEAAFAFSEIRELEDYNRAVQAAEEEHQQRVLEDAETHAENLANLLEDYNERTEDAAEKHQLNMQQMARDHQRALEELEEEHQSKLLASAEEHADRLADLAEDYQEDTIDARARFEEQLSDLAEQYQEDALEAAVQRAERIADLKEQLQEDELADAERHAEQLADLAEQLAEDEAAAAEDHAKRVADLEEDYNEGVIDDAKDHADRLEDLAENYRDAEKEDAENHRERIYDIEEDYQKAIEEDAENHAKRVLDIEEDYQQASERAEEDHLLRMSRMEQDHLDRLSDLIRERDARGLILEMRDYARRVEEEEEDFDLSKSRRDEDHQDRLREEAERYEELKLKRRERYEEQLQDEIDAYNKRREKRRDNYLDDVKDEDERYEEQKSKRWEQWQERLQDELERYEEWKAKRREEYEDQVADEEERYLDQKERRRKDYEDQLQEIIDAANEAAEERKKQYEKRRQELQAEYALDAIARADEYEKQKQEEAARYAEQVTDENEQYAQQKARREEAYEEKRQDALDDFALASEDRKEAYEKQVEEEEERYEAQREKRIAQYEAERKEAQDEYDFMAARRAEDYERERRQDAEAFARKQSDAEAQFREAMAAEEDRYNEAYSEREADYRDQLIQLQNELADEERLLEDAHLEKMRNLAGFFGDTEESYQDHYDRLLDDVRNFLLDYQNIWDQLQDLEESLPTLPTIPTPQLPPVLKGTRATALVGSSTDNLPQYDPWKGPPPERWLPELRMEYYEKLHEMLFSGWTALTGEALVEYLNMLDAFVASWEWLIGPPTTRHVDPIEPLPAIPRYAQQAEIPQSPIDDRRWLIPEPPEWFEPRFVPPEPVEFPMWQQMLQKFGAGTSSPQISINMSMDNAWTLPPGTSQETAAEVREVAYDAAYEAISDAMKRAEARLGR